MSDIASELVDLSVEKLHSLHERLHKSEATPAVIEVHHLTTNEMLRRGSSLPKDDAWAGTEVEIDSMEGADLSLMGASVPADMVADVIKSTGSRFADVRVVLTMSGYEMRLDPAMQKFNPNHDPANGQFSSGAGGVGTIDGVISESGKGWSDKVAASLLAGGSPEVASSKVGALFDDMAERADNPDITELKVKGTLLFGGEGLGIPRLQMPQIPANMRSKYIADMKSQGITTSHESVDPLGLKPSQREISGSKAGALYEHFKAENGIPADRAILISKDNYVIDGHHHWAAAVAFDMSGSDAKLPVLRLSVGVKEALSTSLAWSKANGIAFQGMEARKSFDWIPLEKFNPYHDEKGQFSSGTGGASGVQLAVPTNPNDPTPPMNQDKPAGEGANPLAVHEATQLRERMLEVEPAMTNEMKNLAIMVGANMAGLESRMKSTESLTRKIEGDAVAGKLSISQAASTISDPLRYTMVLSDSTFVSGMARIDTQLRLDGYVPRVKNAWRQGDPIQYTNIKMSKDGNNYELQLHTPSSWDHAQAIHPIYERFRIDKNPDTSKVAWDHMSDEALNNVTRPDHHETLKGMGKPYFQTYTTPAERGLTKSVGEYALSSMEEPKRYTLGAMYIPDRYDAHKEWTSPVELEEASWRYVRTGDRRIRLQHNKEIVAGEWVSIMSFPYEITVPIIMTDGTTTEHTYPAHTVFLGVVWKEWAWELVKAGKIMGYSIGGRAQRLYIDMEKSTEVNNVLYSQEREEA